ncbi:hypothetical protein Phpb_04230 [Photorhabdus namnaonensis]|uniref:Uncharacterized protein n=1 Tax=Photorhabdus namnaonensis TaxID=1851568 RepID=A0A1B8YC80_9GAMM|nr:hypothetical protein Phpb_04230 [Photorhabdus namnaonensis]
MDYFISLLQVYLGGSLREYERVCFQINDVAFIL